MIGKRLISFLKRTPTSQLSSSSKSVEEPKSTPWGRRVVSGTLICLTGGVALSALDDLFIYQGFSSKAMERASKNQTIIDAIGEPIVRGPWYNASLAVAHKRHSVSCTFPVSGPQGTGTVQFKAVRTGDDTWYSFLLSRDWEVLIMEALLHVPSNEEKQRTFRINLLDNIPSPATIACIDCRSPESAVVREEVKSSNYLVTYGNGTYVALPFHTSFRSPNPALVQGRSSMFGLLVGMNSAIGPFVLSKTLISHLILILSFFRFYMFR